MWGQHYFVVDWLIMFFTFRVTLACAVRPVAVPCVFGILATGTPCLFGDTPYSAVPAGPFVQSFGYVTSIKPYLSNSMLSKYGYFFWLRQRNQSMYRTSMLSSSPVFGCFFWPERSRGTLFAMSLQNSWQLFPVVIDQKREINK